MSGSIFSWQYINEVMAFGGDIHLKNTSPLFILELSLSPHLAYSQLVPLEHVTH